MLPRDHGFGTSFLGVGSYLLSDKRDEDAPEAANTNERVAWTHCHNLGTQDAEMGFRVMAACAMDKTRLRQQAHERAQEALPEEERKPFRNTGRKSNDDVWHFSLGWHEDDEEGLTKESMIEDALAALAVIGKENANVKRGAQYAVEHQVILVCHEEEDTKPHIHAVVNRVHPEHGLKLQDYNDWKRFSRWAQEYEEQRKVCLLYTSPSPRDS